MASKQKITLTLAVLAVLAGAAGCDRGDALQKVNGSVHVTTATPVAAAKTVNGISDRATVGAVSGATPIVFSGAAAPAD